MKQKLKSSKINAFVDRRCHQADMDRLEVRIIEFDAIIDFSSVLVYRDCFLNFIDPSNRQRPCSAAYYHSHYLPLLSI